ncbi:CoA-binding protein [uncultured Rhodoferax sp.]|uniref:CoA-binding protein n=1 Tax=uncultured Rhodoferax sp. TaxID=223188 RepID=UPI0025ED1D40|nr:CoA-binding protein [uncultured Rhodoferax sp.]
MTTAMTESQTIAELVRTPRTVAVVGLSPKPHRDSFKVAQYLQRQGWRIVPINPNASEILGEKVYRSLTEAAAHARIELVNVFRNSEDVPPVVDEAMAIGAPAIWLQLGIRHDAALAKAQAAGLQTVQDKCLLVEHARRAP